MAFDSDDDDDEEEEENESYLASYSDLVTDLMAIFVMLFSFAMMAVAQQNYNMRSEMDKSSQNSGISSGIVQESQVSDDFDKIYGSIEEKINQSGYSDSILLEKNNSYINFRFKDNVLFYPDSKIMRETSFDILQYMGNLLLSINNNIGSIEISGYTARVGEDYQANLLAWELSSDRAIAVLQFFVDKCSLPQSKMVVSGYSHYRPVVDADNEEAKSLNRRVEIKIIRNNAQ